MAEKKGAETDGTNKNKRAMILYGIIALLLAVSVGAVAFLLGSRSAPALPALDGSAPQVARRAEAAGLGPMVDIEAFVINILDEKDTRYLKAALTIEVDSSKAASEVEDRMPQVRDAILLLVGNKTYDELRDLQGKLQLRAEMAARLNGLLQSGQVKKIYFTDFVVQ